MKEAINQLLTEFDEMKHRELEHRAKMMKEFNTRGENQMGRIQVLNYAIGRLTTILSGEEKK